MFRDAETSGIFAKALSGFGPDGRVVANQAVLSVPDPVVGGEKVVQSKFIYINRRPLTCALLEAIEGARTNASGRKSLQRIAREAGVDYTSLSRFVARKRDLSVINVGRLAAYFGLSITPSEDGPRSRELRCMFDYLSRRFGGRIRINYFAKQLVRQALVWNHGATQGSIAKWTGIPAASLSDLLRVRRYYLGLSSIDKLLSYYHISVVVTLVIVRIRWVRRTVRRTLKVYGSLRRSRCALAAVVGQQQRHRRLSHGDSCCPRGCDRG